MDSTGKNILGAAVFLGLSYYVLKEKRQKITTETRNLQLKIIGVNLDEGDLIINVKIVNPDSDDMAIQSFKGDVLSGNTRVGVVNMFGNYLVRANDEITVPLVVKAILINIIMAAFKKERMNITFDGTINVDGNSIPLKFSYAK